MNCGERKIPFRWMYATGGLLLLPADGRWRLLDAVDEMSRLFLFEWRDDLRAGGILRGMMAARMEDAAGRRIGR